MVGSVRLTVCGCTLWWDVTIISSHWVLGHLWLLLMWYVELEVIWIQEKAQKFSSVCTWNYGFIESNWKKRDFSFLGLEYWKVSFRGRNTEFATEEPLLDFLSRILQGCTALWSVKKWVYLCSGDQNRSNQRKKCLLKWAIDQNFLISVTISRTQHVWITVN